MPGGYKQPRGGMNNYKRLIKTLNSLSPFPLATGAKKWEALLSLYPPHKTISSRRHALSSELLNELIYNRQTLVYSFHSPVYIDYQRQCDSFPQPLF